MNSKLKWIIASLIIIAVTVAVACSSAEDLTANSGIWTGGFTWELDSEGILHINGTGRLCGTYIPDDGDNPGDNGWDEGTYLGEIFDHTVRIERVEIGEGITAIGERTFMMGTAFTWLSEVSFPASLTSVEESAFSDCVYLSDVNYPLSYAETKKISFAGDNQDLAKAIWHCEDDDYDGVYSVRTGSSGNNITWSLNRNGLLTITGTGVMTNHPWDTFGWAVNQVKINSGITSISDYAFFNIDITSITLPSGITDIGNSALSCCVLLEDVYYPLSYAEIANIRIGSDNSCLVEAAWHCSDGVFSNVFFACGGSCGDNILWTLDEDGLLTLTGTGEMAEYGGGWDTYNSHVRSIVIMPGITTITDSAFAACRATQVTIPGSVTEIGCC